MKRILIIVCLFVVGFSASSTFSQTTTPLPRLVLVLAIDQMRFDYLVRFDPLYKGGLRRLLDRGAIFHERQLPSCRDGNRSRTFGDAHWTSSEPFRDRRE